jgi:hypothetical protein
MPIRIDVRLPDGHADIFIRNVGPTNDAEGLDEGGERRYEWMAGERRGTVRHCRRDGWPMLVAIVMADIAARGDAFPQDRLTRPAQPPAGSPKGSGG